MIVLDTNVLARLLLDDDEQQRKIATHLFSLDEVYTAPVTVMLELAWVIRHQNKSVPDLVLGLTRLLDLPNFHAENEAEVRDALDSCLHGMDFADALHVALSRRHGRFLTFDKDFVKAAKKTSKPPTVALATKR
jgi:predicted nucleic acid-binding protein